MSDWTSDTNDALTLSLVRALEDQIALGDDESYEDFHPAFTYPIYGEDEKIYGYNGLKIDLRFTSGSLVQYLSVTYTKKLQSSATADDVEETLSKYIPPSYFRDETQFLAKVQEDATTFKPYGQLIYSYTRAEPTRKGKAVAHAQPSPESEDVITFEVYHATRNTPGFLDYHKRMQLFILLYIEAGSYINDDDDQWEFVVLYEKHKRRGTPDSTYHFMGYSSLYNFYCFPEKTRLRLSQFVILPPYQRSGHGSELYKAIYQYIVAQPHIAELTVEDPAEAFEDLRDRNDLQLLLTNQKFMEEGFGSTPAGGRVGGVGKGGRSGRGAAVRGKMGPPTEKVWAEKWRTDLKIAGRQFHRLVEMILLFRIDPADEKALRSYRLQVKERIYRFNFDALAQLEKQERLDKLEETFQSVQEGYARILATVLK